MYVGFFLFCVYNFFWYRFFVCKVDNVYSYILYVYSCIYFYSFNFFMKYWRYKNFSCSEEFLGNILLCL